jgi:hypothetical protein
VTRLVWPQVNTAKPYDLSTVFPQAQPTKPTVGVRDLDFDVHVPRKSRGKDADGNHVYWCWSCNRRVENVNQPFCKRVHQAQREKFTRERRDAYRKPVKVPRKVIEDLHRLHEAIGDAAFELDRATTPQAGREARDRLKKAIAGLGVFLYLNLPKQPVTHRSMPSRGQWEATDNDD